MVVCANAYDYVLDGLVFLIKLPKTDAILKIILFSCDDIKKNITTEIQLIILKHSSPLQNLKQPKTWIYISCFFLMLLLEFCSFNILKCYVFLFTFLL